MAVVDANYKFVVVGIGHKSIASNATVFESFAFGNAYMNGETLCRPKTAASLQFIILVFLS